VVTFRDKDGFFKRLFKDIRYLKGLKNNSQCIREIILFYYEHHKDKLDNSKHIIERLVKEKKQQEIIQNRKNRLNEYGVSNIQQEIAMMLLKKVPLEQVLSVVAENCFNYAQLSDECYKQQYTTLANTLTPSYLEAWQKLLLYLCKGLGIQEKHLSNKNYIELYTFAKNRDNYIDDSIQFYFDNLKSNGHKLKEIEKINSNFKKLIDTSKNDKVI
jgi:hypothetical protein